MTTAAYKYPFVAYDSRETIGNIITDNDCNKKTTHNGIHYILGCSSCDEKAIIEAYDGDGLLPEELDPFEGIVVDQGTVYRVVGGEGRILKEKQRKDNHFAIGSGAMIALAAMDLGLSAKDAVKQAITRDTCTGGKVRSFNICNGN